MAKILIIEDDRAISDIERDYLELSGFETDVAYDGVDGLNKALSGGFDLILLDLMLPGLDGFTICKKLREKLDIPILMVTARTQDIDKIRGKAVFAERARRARQGKPCAVRAAAPCGKIRRQHHKCRAFYHGFQRAHGVDRRVRA